MSKLDKDIVEANTEIPPSASVQLNYIGVDVSSNGLLSYTIRHCNHRYYNRSELMDSAFAVSILLGIYLAITKQLCYTELGYQGGTVSSAGLAP